MLYFVLRSLDIFQTNIPFTAISLSDCLLVRVTNSPPKKNKITNAKNKIILFVMNLVHYCYDNYLLEGIKDLRTWDLKNYDHEAVHQGVILVYKLYL